MQFTRWIIKGEEPTNELCKTFYVCLGNGYTQNIAQAHLYSSEELAKQKLKSEEESFKGYVKHTGRTVTFEIITCQVDVQV